MENIVNNDNSEEIEELYLVLKNCEEQYSLWPECKKVPVAWEVVFGLESKKNCIQYVNETWVDMRPLSLRKKMDQGII